MTEQEHDGHHKPNVHSREPEGLIPVIGAFARAAYAMTTNALRPLWRIAKPVGQALMGIVPGLAKGSYRGAKALFLLMATNQDEKGEHHFSTRRLLKSTAIAALCVPVAMYLGIGSYYWATVRTYDNVIIPSTGIFQSQQLLSPGKPGSLTTPRDEIYTILGQHVDEEGHQEPIRFDIDYNPFFFCAAAWRPDLGAAELNRAPYGVRASVRATGLYTRLPRFLRTRLVRAIDLRPEIVCINKVEVLQEMTGSGNTLKKNGSEAPKP